MNNVRGVDMSDDQVEAMVATVLSLDKHEQRKYLYNLYMDLGVDIEYVWHWVEDVLEDILEVNP